MVCPNCGLSIEQPYAESCPRCGYRLAQQSAPPPPLSSQTPGAPTPGSYGGYAPTPNYGTPNYGTPNYGTPNYGTPSYGTPQPQAGYGTQPPTEAYGGYPPQQGAPQGTPQGYGQPASPSPWPQPQPGYAGYPPPQQPPKKRGAGCIIGAVLSVVLIIAVVGAIGVILLNRVSTNSTTNNGHGGPVVSATATAAPTATVAPLYQNSFTSGAEGWANDVGHCFFQNGGYHVKAGYVCYAPIGEQTDVDVTVDVKQLSGSTKAPYGVSVRNGSQGEDYGFDVDSNGKFVIYKCDASTCKALKDYTANAAIHGGLNSSNTLRVVARGSHFEFFINGKSVATVDDSAYATGHVGLECGDGIECVFNNLLITRPL